MVSHIQIYFFSNKTIDCFELQPERERSFMREVVALMPTVEQEFYGQIRLSPQDEMNMNELVVEITPSKGYYAHALFVFLVSRSSSSGCSYHMVSIFHFPDMGVTELSIPKPGCFVFVKYLPSKYHLSG